MKTRPSKRTTLIRGDNVDEVCFVRCTQTISGRQHNAPPKCRSICFRYVAPTETTRGFRGPLGTFAPPHPLPPENQPRDAATRNAAEKGVSGNSGGNSASAKKDLRYWQEGWYVWYGHNFAAATEKLDSMPHDLRTARLEDARKKAYGAFIRSQRSTLLRVPGLYPPPRRPHPDYTPSSTLVYLPTVVSSIADDVHTLLAPAQKALVLLDESVSSGAQRALAGRVWEKACSRDPWVLARNVCDRVYKAWNAEPPEDNRHS
ncbi:hypothetical protein PLICRDRAFT_34698 [Plicaturopsis crispa FD-325 SS-3]|nr:hypothetical protein PLICRDRAFT_34698 [Plicaturopsis crispa FD-325 SS-3]